MADDDLRPAIQIRAKPLLHPALSWPRSASLAQVRELVAKMTNEQRLEFFAAVKNGYCPHCGRDLNEPRGCQCNNDE